jgi:lipopolysaccharide biosynthesis glycosyltransferase
MVARHCSILRFEIKPILIREARLNQIINLVVGFDQREAVAYHVFCQSVMDRSSLPVRFLPLGPALQSFYTETHGDGSNQFIYTRFLTPFLMGYEGWAIFADGDMVMLDDPAKLWALRDPEKAVQVVQHDYQTIANIKYLGNVNQNYPRKNWSSVVLWNCGHPANRILTPEFVQDKPGSYLHRFSWLKDEDIGEISKSWNWLAMEYPDNPQAALVHYTLGTPCFKDFRQSAMSTHWHDAHQRSQQGMEEE